MKSFAHAWLVRVTTVLGRLVGLKQTVVTGFELSETALLVNVKPTPTAAR